MNAFIGRVTIATVSSPAQDRRALSQAWYDSLHLAKRDVAGRSPRGHSAPGLSVFPSVGKPAARLFPLAILAPEKARRPFAERPPRLASIQQPLERRAAVSPLARVVAGRIRNNPSLSRFVLETAQGRVMVHVVRGPEGVRVWALCPKAMQPRVERALAQARFALAGLRVQVR